MALTLSREVASVLPEVFAAGKWHADEDVYASFQHVSRQIVEDVVQCELICYVFWERKPG